MSNILSGDDFGLKIYNRFPPKYREDDAGQDYALKRYIEALSDGGFKPVIEDINRLTYLLDPDNIDSKMLPLLFEQYGLKLFNGIPELYLRYLLPRLGEAWSMKGTLDVIEFITTSLSGIKTNTQIDYDEKGNPYIIVRLEMDYNIDDSYFPNSAQLNKLLINFVPFYCDLDIFYSYMFYEAQNIKMSEKATDKIRQVYSESASILNWKKPPSVFGKAIAGKSIFGYRGETVIKHEDYIDGVLIEDLNLVLPESIDLASYNGYNIENDSKISCDDSCYSVITINGKQTRLEY